MEFTAHPHVKFCLARMGNRKSIWSGLTQVLPIVNYFMNDHRFVRCKIHTNREDVLHETSVTNPLSKVYNLCFNKGKPLTNFINQNEIAT